MSDHDVRRQVARALLDAGAVMLRPDDPFTWASGIRSPIYCDNRITLGHPAMRSMIADHLVSLVAALDAAPEAVAGVATAGIPQAALVADRLELPMLYVRASRKGHGKENRIEGRLPPGARVVVIEDLVSTGGSSLAAVEALREAGASVDAALAVFSYGLPVAETACADARVDLRTLTDLETLLSVASDEGLLTDAHRAAVLDWRRDPNAWRDTELVEPDRGHETSSQ